MVRQTLPRPHLSLTPGCEVWRQEPRPASSPPPGSGPIRDAQAPSGGDSAVVALLRDKGALLFPFANMSEIGISVHGYNAVYGQCRNPHNLGHVSGGSSSGCAAAVAAGLFPAAIGCAGVPPRLWRCAAPGRRRRASLNALVCIFSAAPTAGAPSGSPLASAAWWASRPRTTASPPRETCASCALPWA